jgi:hypothetical protein
VEPKAGQHHTLPTPDRCAAEFAQIMAELALNYPTAQTIHLVVDNLNIHCRKSLTDHYGEIPGTKFWNRFTVHYTPKHGSWLNQAEIEISLFARQCLGTRRLPTLARLKEEARAWNATVNEARTKIDWRSVAKTRGANWVTTSTVLSGHGTRLETSAEADAAD